MFDREKTLERVGGDVALLREIVEIFRQDAPRLVKEIREAIERRDAEGLARAAHGLRGSIANFGAEPACECARSLEMSGRRGDVLAARAELERLESRLGELMEALAEFVEGREE